MKGITIEDVELSILQTSPPTGKRKRKPLDIRRGPLLMTHFGFSGPTVMNLSRVIAQHESDPLLMRCDFLPEVTDQTLSEEIRTAKQNSGRQPVANMLTNRFPRRLIETLLGQADVPTNQKNADLPKNQANRLIEVLKRTDLPIHGTRGYKKAEVTAGGIDLKEVDSRDMQSKLQAGLYFAGEILDIDGPIGGFNFQAAFSTGWLVGKNA